jgi:DNA-binding NarL/FixJ family response regulator
VLIVDDHPAVRFGLRLLLEREGLTVVGEADSLEAARQMAATSRPDLAIVDLSLGDEDGLELLAELGRGEPGLALLVYSMHEDVEHIQRALGAGARGYFAKRESAAQLGEGLRSILAGAVYLSPRIARALAEAPATTSRQLSQKEQEIFDLLGEGLGTSAIAARLDLSPRTVESYFARMLAKLGLGGTRELRQQAIARRSRG